MKTQKVFAIISAVILALQIAAETFATWIIVKLNMLPAKYFVALLAVFLLLTAMTATFMFLRGKKPVGIIRRIISWLFAILIIAGCLLAGKLAFDAYKTIKQVTVVETTNVLELYVVVREKDPAKTVEDTAQYPYGIIADYDEDHTQEAIRQLEEITGKPLNISSFEKITDIADGLLNEKVDALIINGAALALLIEDENYEDFLEKTRILHTFLLDSLEAEQEPEPEPTQPDKQPTPEKKDITNTPFVIYFSGSDTRSKKLRTSRSDVNILAVVNPKTKQILLINTPRDYYVGNPAGKGKKDKLTHCGLYGTENSMKALGELYGLEINHYAQINFSGFETLVDAVGGVTVHSDQAFTAGKTVKIKVGENQLNGEEALKFARERYHVSGGDRTRGKNQMKVIKAIVEKATSGTTLISNYGEILSSLEGMFKTNVTSEELSLLVKMQLSDMAQWNIVSYAVTGTGGSEKNYSSPGHKAYVMHPDMKTVEKASDLANRVLAGETLSEADVK